MLWQRGDGFSGINQEVSKTYGKNKSLLWTALILRLRKEKYLDLLGPNGAGKTTTIKMLTGILPPDKGSIVIDGVDWLRTPLKQKGKSGMCPTIQTYMRD